MALEPTSSSDSGGVTMLALIVGGLVVMVALLFGFGAFDNRAPDATISIDAPTVPAPAPAPTTP